MRKHKSVNENEVVVVFLFSLLGVSRESNDEYRFRRVVNVV